VSKEGEEEGGIKDGGRKKGEMGRFVGIGDRIGNGMFQYRERAVALNNLSRQTKRKKGSKRGRKEAERNFSTRKKKTSATRKEDGDWGFAGRGGLQGKRFMNFTIWEGIVWNLSQTGAGGFGKKKKALERWGGYKKGVGGGGRFPFQSTPVLEKVAQNLE